MRDLTLGRDYNRNYVNFFPTANITYTYKPNRSIRFNYNGNTRQPTIDQLQPLRNNNDYFKHFFKVSDLEKAFPSIHFERLYCAEIERSDSKWEKDLISDWLDDFLKTEGVTDPKEIALEKKDYLKSKNEAGIVAKIMVYQSLIT